MFSRKIPWDGVLAPEIPVLMRSGKRPEVDPTMPAPIVKLMQRCWAENPAERPTFAQIESVLDQSLDVLLVYERKSSRSVFLFVRKRRILLPNKNMLETGGSCGAGHQDRRRAAICRPFY